MKKFQGIFVIIIILFLFSHVLNAQNISGRVLAADDNTPLSGATIRVQLKDSSYIEAFTTDKKGYFFESIEYPIYKLEISYLGYEKNVVIVQRTDSKDIKLDNILLEPVITELDGVEVTAQSLVHKADKIMIYPTEKQVKASVSCLNLLQTLVLPNLFVDPVQESISIQGTSGVIYRINGVKASLNEVKALKPDQIRRIDYKQLPGIRELDSDSGTLDFILKEPHTGTSISSSMLSALTTGMLNGNFNLRTNYRKSVFSIDYNINHRNYSKRKTSETENYFFPDGNILNWDKQGEYAPFGYTQHNIGVGYLLKNQNDILNIRFNNSIYTQHDENIMNIFQNQEKILHRNIYSTFSHYIPSIDLTYNRNLSKDQGIELNVVGTLSDYDYNRRLKDTKEDKISSDINNITDGNLISIIGEVFYWKENENLNFSAGLKSSYQFVHNTYYPSDDITIQNFTGYPYLQVNGAFRNISYTFGTGLEYQHQKQTTRRSNYFRNTFSLSLSYKREKWNIKYNINYRPFFPDLSSLSDVLQNIDTISATKGNSELKPYSNLRNQIDFTVSDNRRFISMLTLTANKAFNPIQQDIVFSELDNKFIYQEHNQDYDINYGAQLIVQMSNIFKLFTIQAFGGWNHYKSKGDLYSHVYDDFYYGFYIGMTYKDLNVNAVWRKPQKTLFGHYLTTGENYSNISASYKIKRVGLGCGVQFPFADGAKYRTQRLAENAFSDRNVLIRNNRNMFYLSISYDIQWGRSIFNMNKRLYNSENGNSILKINDN